MVIKRQFYQRNAEVVAEELLGAYLVHKSPAGTTIGRIVETEAYLSVDDPACHASRGKTPRNAPMFGPAGRSYVYFIYGMHFCFNIVTGELNQGEAVLIRALEPVEGIPLMEARRKTAELKKLANGPSKLVMAMGLGREHNDLPLTRGPLKVLSPETIPQPSFSIVRTTRIGISQGADLPLRFCIKGSQFLSRG